MHLQLPLAEACNFRTKIGLYLKFILKQPGSIFLLTCGGKVVSNSNSWLTVLGSELECDAVYAYANRRVPTLESWWEAIARELYINRQTSLESEGCEIGRYCENVRQREDPMKDDLACQSAFFHILEIDFESWSEIRDFMRHPESQGGCPEHIDV